MPAKGKLGGPAGVAAPFADVKRTSQMEPEQCRRLGGSLAGLPRQPPPHFLSGSLPLQTCKPEEVVGEVAGLLPGKEDSLWEDSPGLARQFLGKPPSSPPPLSAASTHKTITSYISVGSRTQQAPFLLWRTTSLWECHTHIFRLNKVSSFGTGSPHPPMPRGQCLSAAWHSPHLAVAEK